MAGFITVTVIFVVLNIRSYEIGKAEYLEDWGSSALWISHGGFFWGFPTATFYEACFQCYGFFDKDILGINALIWFFTASIVGYFLKWVVDKRHISSGYK